MIRKERRTQTIRRGYRAPLGYRYCEAHAPQTTEESRWFTLTETDNSNLSERPCDACHAHPSEWPRTQQSMVATIEYVNGAKIF